MRVSVVGSVVADSLQFATVLTVGDAVEVRPRSKALAVQRQISRFGGDEGRFDAYPVFTRKLPAPPVLDEPVRRTTDYISREIRVGALKILGASASSVIQIGSNRMIDADARVKHIRQIIRAASNPKPANRRQNR